MKAELEWDKILTSFINGEINEEDIDDAVSFEVICYKKRKLTAFIRDELVYQLEETDINDIYATIQQINMRYILSESQKREIRLWKYLLKKFYLGEKWCKCTDSVVIIKKSIIC